MLEFCPISSKYIAPPGSTCLTPIWHPTLSLCCLKICDKSSTTTGLWWGAKKRTNLYRGSSIQRNVHIYKVLFSSIFMSSQIFREDFCCFFCRRARISSWCDVFLVMKCKKYAALIDVTGTWRSQIFVLSIKFYFLGIKHKIYISFQKEISYILLFFYVFFFSAF